MYYQISGGFTNSYSSTYSPEFGDDIFKYGHVGNYTTHSTPTFAPSSVWVKDKQTGDSVYYANAWVLTDWTYDTLVTYKPSTYNPGIAQWMQQYYSFFPVTNTPNGFYNSYEMLNLYGAILNGGGVPGSYTDASGNLLFSNVNAPQSTSYGYGNTNFFDFRIDVSGDIKGHQIELGINYDQRVSRSYNIGAYSLWTLMRQLQNRHIGQLDLANGWVVPGSQMDTVYYGLKDDGSQSTFDKNLREKLGMTNTTGIYTNKDWLDIDSYDPSTFSLNMFSVEDLLNSGNPVVGYAGYDAWGKKTKGQASFDDFFKTGSSRTISAASPVMMSGYIQDKFVFEDLIFQVGLRLDRYDNNTWVMKDPYLMYDAKTVGQVGGTHPGNIGNDYVVYVDDPTQANPTIMGYRSGSTWYNKNGIQIDDSELKTISGGSGEPTPYLSDPNVIRTKEKNFNAFKDYEPQTTLSPRLAFSFPISDEAVFIAHYDVMTKRPTNNAFPYMSYLYMEDKYTSAVLTNPDLKFERNTDYEVGFQQALGKEKIAALKFTAYYKEVRDLIQVSVVSGAYPKTYYTYSNLDFLTIKGLSLTYDLRRVKNIAMSANYTLQFANGTGSDPTSQLSFVQNGYPNLRTLSPLSTDQRHMIKVDLDFRYFDGKDYNGPIIRRKVTEGGVEKVKEYRIFTNSGIHLTGQAVSGTPYTKRVGAVDRLIKSDINNATNPWQFYVNARIDKNFPFLLGKEGGKRRFANLEAYVEIMNLLNIRNIPSVDAVTGNYNDDGRLEDPKFQPTINAQADPVSYVQMYQMFVNDSPYNIALPIRARLGFIFSF